MGTVVATKYVRKPLYVDAVQVNEDNFGDVALWCMGDITRNDGGENLAHEEIDPKAHHIRIRVHNPQSQRQTKAFVGDWILYTDRGYKIYTEKAFKDNFDVVRGVGEAVTQGIPEHLPPEPETSDPGRVSA